MSASDGNGEVHSVFDGKSDSSDPEEVFISTLMTHVLEEEWEQVLLDLSQFDRFVTDDGGGGRSTRTLGSLLCAAASAPSIPVGVFQSVLQLDPRAAVYQDAARRTALHITIMMQDRPDLVQTLVQTSPSCIQLRDLEGLRAVEILTQKILMKEERLRYLGKRRTALDEQVLNDNWECARLMVAAHVGGGPDDLPLLHACLQATDIPLALLERAIRKYDTQLRLRDKMGNLPLHHVAATLPAEDSDDLLEAILQHYRNGAGIQNNTGQWPLDLAIRAGRRWDSGICLLLDAYPRALENQHITLSFLPLILNEFQNHQRPEHMFALLRMNPEVISAKRGQLQ